MVKGYRPLAWRVKTRRGEIDLIMRSGRRIVFVEVKTRADIDTGPVLGHSTEGEANGRCRSSLARPQNTRLLDVRLPF